MSELDTHVQYEGVEMCDVDVIIRPLSNISYPSCL